LFISENRLLVPRRQEAGLVQELVWKRWRRENPNWNNDLSPSLKLENFLTDLDISVSIFKGKPCASK
jgi:hypothetical protein